VVGAMTHGAETLPRFPAIPQQARQRACTTSGSIASATLNGLPAPADEHAMSPSLAGMHYLRFQNGGRKKKGPLRGLKGPDLGVESGRAEVCDSALSDPAPSYWATVMVPIARRAVQPRRGWALGVC
jgi:hypothetical protein